MSRLKLIVATSLAACLLSSNAFALLIITNPIDYDTANLVGTADPGVAPATIDNERAWAQQILDLAAGTEITILGVEYRTHNTDDYAGTLAGGVKNDSGSNSVPAGFEYVLGKYDGPLAGYVLFYLGGEAAIIPAKSDTIWTNVRGKGYDLSHWTAFGTPREVSEPGTLALLGAGVFLLGLLRRRRVIAG